MLLGFFSILTCLIFFTSCGKESIDDLAVEKTETVKEVEAVETIDAETTRLIEAFENITEDALNKGCNSGIQAKIIKALDVLIADLRAFRCGYASAASVQTSFENYKSQLQAILGLPFPLPGYVNANPNGGGCVSVSASGTLGAVYALDFLGCRIGTFLNNPTNGKWEDVITAFEFYLSVLESVFICDWNIPAYRNVLEAGC